MERIALIVEETGQRLTCLLNPPSLVMRRRAGVNVRRSAGGHLGGARLADDPLLYTGGGWTELDLDLLFDVNLSIFQSSARRPRDVRDLTKPLLDLAENQVVADGYGSPPRVRFVWGKTWNVPCVILEVAERLENFWPNGEPMRSWMRMRLRRVQKESIGVDRQQAPPRPLRLPTGEEAVPFEDLRTHLVTGSQPAGSNPTATEGWNASRLDLIAHRHYRNPALWRVIASFNSIVNPFAAFTGSVLRVPPRSLFERLP